MLIVSLKRCVIAREQRTTRYTDGIMRTEDLRAWVHAKRAAEAREREESRTTVVDATDSIRTGLALIALAARLHGWPLPEDSVTKREDAEVRERWSVLRRRWRS
jgi:hypothetical protein